MGMRKPSGSTTILPTCPRPQMLPLYEALLSWQVAGAKLSQASDIEEGL